MVFRHLIPLTYGNFPIVYKNEYRAGHVLYEHFTSMTGHVLWYKFNIYIYIYIYIYNIYIYYIYIYL